MLLVPVKRPPLKINLQLTLLKWLEWLLQQEFYCQKQGLDYQQEEKNFSNETQLLCLLAGANSIFYGDSLLTTENNEMIEDQKLISEFSKKDFLKSNNKSFLLGKFNSYNMLFREQFFLN